jgi:hypothetical protein
VIWHVIGWYLFIALLFGVFIWSMDTRKRTKEKRPKTDTAFERRLQAVMMGLSWPVFLSAFVVDRWRTRSDS